MTSEEKILVAVDGSSDSEFALNWYMSHIHVSTYQVLLVHCVKTPVRFPYPIRVTLMITDEEEQQSIKEQKEKTKKIIEKYKETCEKLNLRAKILTVEGNAGPQLIKIATEEKCRLIVIGTRAHGVLRRTVLGGGGGGGGSVTSYVRRHSSVPVTVCGR